MTKAILRFTDLPFTVVDENNILVSTWNPDRSGSYPVQCARGRSYAEQLIELMRKDGNPTLLAKVARGMDKTLLGEGVEVGFFTEIGWNLIQTV